MDQQTPQQPNVAAPAAPVAPVQTMPTAPATPPTPPQAPAPAPHNSWLMPVLIAALVLIIGGGAASYFLFMQPSATPATSNQKLVRIGLSLDTIKIQRWGEERDIMTQRPKISAQR